MPAKRNRKSFLYRLARPFALRRRVRSSRRERTGLLGNEDDAAIESRLPRRRSSDVADWHDEDQQQFQQNVISDDSPDNSILLEEVKDGETEIDEFIEISSSDDNDSPEIVNAINDPTEALQLPQKECLTAVVLGQEQDRLLQEFPDSLVTAANAVQDDFQFRPVTPMSMGSDDSDDNNEDSQYSTNDEGLQSTEALPTFDVADADDQDFPESFSMRENKVEDDILDEDGALGDTVPGIESRGHQEETIPDSSSNNNNTTGEEHNDTNRGERETKTDGEANPEKLFRSGATVIVDIVKGKYKKFQRGTITGIQKSVQVLIQDTEKGDEIKQCWLKRSSLSYMGKPFPEIQETTNKAPNSREGLSTEDNDPEKQKATTASLFNRGEHVDIVGGTHKGKTGRVLDVKKKVKVIIFDNPEIERWLEKKSLARNLSPIRSTANHESFYSCGESQNSETTKFTTHDLDSRSKNPVSSTASNYMCDGSWRLADSDLGGKNLGLRFLRKMRFQLFQEEDTLLASWFQKRIRLVEIPINNDELTIPIQKSFEDAGSKFELAVSKIQSDGDKASPMGVPSKKCIQLYYCQVAGPGLKDICLAKEFERIADFASLGPKVVARMELFLSPAYKLKSRQGTKTHAIHMLNPKTFCQIEERGNEGCGFISEDLIVELLGGGKAAKRVYAIQVRGSSVFGMFKGVLVKKRITHGQPPIQIPSSMIVVGPSRCDDRRENEFLVINRNGIHPNTTNDMVHRLLTGVGTTKTYRKELKRKKLSAMMTRLWNGLGVPNEVFDQYISDSQKEENLRHAYVVGVADPTSSLPSGSVFIPGLNYEGEVFVTRSPCLEVTDARKIPVVTTKPADMSEEDWNFLQGLSFGSIMFANPKPGEIPMPLMIADGDLDGDLYFICWHFDIVKHAQTLPMDPTSPQPERKAQFPPDNNWFEQAQDRMVDARSSQLLSQLIGKLYSKAVAIAAENDNFADSEDYKAFAAAYKAALKIGKHGGTVFLPARLHSALPQKFHYVLTDFEQS